MRRVHYPEHLPYDGAWIDQPYILIRELETVEVAEREHARMKAVNAQIRTKQTKGG